MRLRPPANGLTSNTLILLVAVFLIVFANQTFFAATLRTYPPAVAKAPALLSLLGVFGGAIVFLLALVCFRRTTKPFLVGILLLSSAAAYFMDSFGVVVSDDMLRNVVQTNVGEALDLFNLKLLAYLLLLGVLPSLAVARVRLHWRGARSEAWARLKLLAVTLATMIGLVLAFGSFYASLFREHKALRSYANPTYPLYAALKLGGTAFSSRHSGPIAAIGMDAHLPPGDKERELVVLVVGETARADRFSLNGYARDTNPELSKLNVFSFTNFWACGTSTAVSVPCMFAQGGQAAQRSGEIPRTENLLDIFQRAGVNVLWMDNNSDSKGVALRVPYRNFRTAENNPVCDEECRDEGMLGPLREYIESHPSGDIFVVLHQMGNHGPAYYKRYPKAFEKFTPVCRSNELSQCSQEEIDNSYDNAILYTDHFLGRLIHLLSKYDDAYETAMFYVSDHGESLGESGTYLHGLPNAIAPDVQLHVPAVMWFGRGFAVLDRDALQRKLGARFTHDNIFFTALGFLEVESAVYRRDMDLLDGAKSSHD